MKESFDGHIRTTEKAGRPDARSRRPRYVHENIDKEKIEKAVAEIAKGGKENLLGLIEMLGEPGSEEDVKPHYALHCVVNHALVVGDEKLRKDCCDAMASQLDSDKLIRLQPGLPLPGAAVGRAETRPVPALGKLLLDEELTEPAAMALVAIGGERAASQLRAAVPQAKGKCRLNRDRRPGRAGRSERGRHVPARPCRTRTARCAWRPAPAWPSWATPRRRRAAEGGRL